MLGKHAPTQYSATKCPGESPALIKCIVINVYTVVSFQRILKVHFGEIGHLNHLATCYTVASHLSLPQAWQDLVVGIYIWAFRLYHKERAHVIHLCFIQLFLVWCGFTIGVYDCTRKGTHNQWCALQNSKKEHTAMSAL